MSIDEMEALGITWDELERFGVTYEDMESEKAREKIITGRALEEGRAQDS